MKQTLASALAGVTLLASAAILTGCASTSVDKQQYTKNGVTYGDVGPFRGRWWNYYERGRSYLDGEYFAEAEADLRTALSKRTNDQRWARTYGLHFVPEYFPNRELGVALFSQGNHAEAIPLLEESYNQTPSARAAYYLELARGELAKNTDQSAPTITFASDLGQTNRAASSILLRATASDDSYIKAIRIDGAVYPVAVSAPTIEIRERVQLAAGANAIEVTAIDVTGKETTTAFTWQPDLEGPAISFDGPVTIPGAISGVAYDPASVDSMTVAGNAVAITQNADGTANFSFTVDSSSAGPVLFEARDSLGNATRGPVPVTTVLNAKFTNPDILLAADTHTVPYRDNVNAIMRGDEILALQLAQATPNELTIECVQDGLNYRLDEIVLGFRAYGPDPIDSVNIDGIPVEHLIPGRREQRISRRIALATEGANSVTITVRDQSGNEVSREVTINRVLTELELINNKLNIAMVGSVWDGTTPDIQEEADFLTDAVQDALLAQNRFKILDRANIDAIIEEQLLVSALGDRDSRAALGQQIDSEVLVIGKIHKSFDSIEIILQAIDPMSTRVIGYADVAGPKDTIEQLEALADDLALRFRQLFPEVEGTVEETRSNGRLVTDLSQLDGIRQYLKCVVYRKGEEIIDPNTGDSLGAPVEIITQGYFDDVQNDNSLLFVSEGDTQPIQVSDLVATK